MSPSDQPEGSGVTVKEELFAVCPLTLTEKGPDVALAGTNAMMLLSDQLATAEAVPLTETELVPCVAPKPVPVIATDTPTAPDAGEIFVMFGAWANVRPAHARKHNRAAIRLRACARIDLPPAIREIENVNGPCDSVEETSDTRR